MQFRIVPVLVVLSLATLMGGCLDESTGEVPQDSRRTTHKLVVVSTDTADQLFWMLRSRDPGGWEHDNYSNPVGDTIAMDTIPPGGMTDTITLQSHTKYWIFSYMTAWRPTPWGGSYARSSSCSVSFLPGDSSLYHVPLVEGVMQMHHLPSHP